MEIWIFTALLAKQLGMRVAGGREATGDSGVDGLFRSVAHVVDGASVRKLRAFKKDLKAAAITRR